MQSSPNASSGISVLYFKVFMEAIKIVAFRVNASSEMLVSTHKLHSTTTQNTTHHLNVTAMCPTPSGVNYWCLTTKFWTWELRSCQVA
jgi:hypothetical protein